MSVWEYRGAMSEIPWAAEACTLPTVDRPVRQAEFSWLLARAEMSWVDQTTLQLRLPPETAATVADLIVRETRCCSFFTFALIATAGKLRLDVTVPEAHADVLDAMVRA
jgi:hypothetical protein